LRPIWVVLVLICLTLAGPCLAAPPIYIDSNSADGSSSRGSSSRVSRLPARPFGVDAAEQVHQAIHGTYKAVVILVQFSDMAADTINHTPAAFADLLFSVGTQPTGSLRDYYREVSRGQFDIDGIVTNWVTMPHTYAYYANNAAGFGPPPMNARQLALDAVRAVDGTVNFNQFDNNGPDGIPHSADDDGVVDGLFIVHAGPGNEETDNLADIRSHKFTMPGGPVAVDGVFANAYTMEPERWQNNSPFTTAGALMSIGVFCHEFGHILGRPDLYDTSDSPDASAGIGDWDIMGYGVYTHRIGEPLGSHPAHFSAVSKIALGWIEPVWVLQDSFSVPIQPVESGGDVYRLWTNGIESGEYFLVENRQPIGFDAGLVRSSIENSITPQAAHGLLIYHVDTAVFGNEVAAHKMIDVEEAGGVESNQGFGFHGVQNLDIASGAQAPEQVCIGQITVTGNRGDRHDPWPGSLNRHDFNGVTCPNTDSYCGITSQIGIVNIQESAGIVTADFLVNGTAVRRRAVIVDDSPFDGNANNGNGLVEPGEIVRITFPLENLSLLPTSELYAKVGASEPFAGLLADSIYYGSIGGNQINPGTIIYAGINPTPDPRGLNLLYTVYGPTGLVQADSVQILIGQRTGICEDFEGTDRRWVGIPLGCGGVNEWHREAGVNHTSGGTWAWRLGPEGLIGSYAPSQDARLVSQPVRISGSGDTLRFWQRYQSEFVTDGLTVEISRDGGSTWIQLEPVGGYNTLDRFSGFQSAFTEVLVPLNGYFGVVQFAFRFRSQPPNEGLGWWIDDVRVTGDASCVTTAIGVERFTAEPFTTGAAPSVRLEWSVPFYSDAVIGVDRADGEEPRRRILTLPSEPGAAAVEDRDVLPGGSYSYWLVVSREGEASVEAGPIRVDVPGGGSSAPRVLAMSKVRPNPFRPNATFSVTLDRSGPFVVRVYRADGSLVRTLAQGHGAPAEIPFTWDGNDDRGRAAGSGLYFFELRSGARTRVQKAVLLR
jgi:immune inhibitor A